MKLKYLLTVAATFFSLLALFFFGRMIERKIDITINASSYAPYFDLQKVSNGNWSLEKREQARDIRHQISPNEKERDNFSFRRENPQTGFLLLKCNWTEMIFQYDPDAHNMTSSSQEEWDKATGEIVDGDDGLSFRSTDQPTHQIDKVVIGRRKPTAIQPQGQNRWNFNCNSPQFDCLTTSVPVKGSFGWGYRISPDNNRIVVLSIEGPVGGGGGFIIGPPLVRGGLRYLEMFEIGESKSIDKPEVRKIGKTIRIYDPIESPRLELTWIKDGEFIAVTASDSSTVSFVGIKEFTH